MSATAAAADDVEGILQRAAETGKVLLGVLTDDQECTLGKGIWTMGDPGTWLAWLAVAEEVRRDRAIAALSPLVASGHLIVADEEGTFRVSPWLGLIAETRTKPAFTVATLGRVTDPTLVYPLGYAFADDVGGLRGFLTELRTEGRHDYRFLAPDRFAAGMAQWMYHVVQGGITGIEEGPAALTVFCHPQGLPLKRFQLSVEPVTGSVLRMTLSTGPVETTDVDDIAEVLRHLFEATTKLAAAGQRRPSSGTTSADDMEMSQA